MIRQLEKAIKPMILNQRSKQVSSQESWLTRFSRLMARLVPDAISTSIILLAFLFLAALGIGNTLTATLDAYYRGLWVLLRSLIFALLWFVLGVFAFTFLPS